MHRRTTDRNKKPDQTTNRSGNRKKDREETGIRSGSCQVTEEIRKDMRKGNDKQPKKRETQMEK